MIHLFTASLTWKTNRNYRASMCVQSSQTTRHPLPHNPPLRMRLQFTIPNSHPNMSQLAA